MPCDIAGEHGIICKECLHVTGFMWVLQNQTLYAVSERLSFYVNSLSINLNLIEGVTYG